MRHSIGAVVLLAAAAAGIGAGASREQARAAAAASSGSPRASSYESWLFKPTFTVRLPAGWTVAERDSDGAQLWHECKTCPQDGELKGELTLDMALGAMSPSKAIARLRKAANVQAGSPRRAMLGTVSGFEFTANRTGTGDVVFQDSGYHTDAGGAPLEIFAVRAAGRTVTIFIDPGTSRGSAARAFTASALALAKAIRFTG